MPSGLRSGSPAPSVEFMRFAQTSSSSGGIPMKLPITRETTGCATSVTRSQVSRPSSRSSTSTAIARISSSCAAIRLGVKPAWNSALMRSCLGGSIPMNIARVSSSGNTSLTRRDAAALRGVGLPVAADGVDVVGGRHRPVPGLLRVLGDLRRSSAPGTAPRSSRNSSCGGPSRHRCRSLTSTFSRSLPVDAMRPPCRLQRTVPADRTAPGEFHFVSPLAVREVSTVRACLVMSTPIPTAKPSPRPGSRR